MGGPSRSSVTDGERGPRRGVGWLYPLEQIVEVIAILNVGRVHDDATQQALHTHGDVALAASQPFGRIMAASRQEYPLDDVERPRLAARR